MLKSFLRFLFLIPFILFLSNNSVQSQLPGWRGEMPINIYNYSDSALSNYQLLLTLNTQYFINLGLMQINGNDIRFGSDCSGSALYTFWIEANMNTDSTRIWVKIPSLAPGDSTRMYMFFGNPPAPPAGSLAVFNGPWSSTDSVNVTGTNTVANSQRGFRFTVNKPVLVTHFGKKTPNATQRYVTLFNYSTQSIVAQLQVSAGSPGTYNYNLLPQPLWFSTGQQYVLEIFQGTGDMYYYGTSSQINPAFTYGDMRYCNSCTQNTFPTSVLAGYHYGIPDLLFYIRNTASQEPIIISYSPADTNTPLAPTGLAGTAGNEQVLLVWNKNTEFDIAKYLVFQNTTNDPQTAVQIGTTNHPDTTFAVSGLTNFTTYYFWVKAKDLFCTPRTGDFSAVVNVTPISVKKISQQIPIVFALHQNYPNPFNPVTKIRFDLPKGSLVKIIVYDITGKVVDIIVNSYLMAGYHEATFNAVNLASGVYFYKIEARQVGPPTGDFSAEKKMVVLK